MVSVGIMSMQRILNYGSSLQAYSLRRMIESQDPQFTVSYLDYVPGPILVDPPPGSGAPRTSRGRRLAKVREYAGGEGSWADKVRFFRHKRTYANRFFPIVGMTPALNRDLAVDVQVIGSDEVFNCVQSNTNVGYSRDLFGHGSPAGRVISYAASFGNTTLEKIDRAGIRADLEGDLGRLDHISVRDRNSSEIVQELTGRVPAINVDPVLAYDLMTLEPRIPAARLVDRPYIIVYGYSGRLSKDENAELRRYADGLGALILTFGGVQGCADRFVDCSPFELLAYFRDAEAVVTDTFHGTIFSIINSTPFATIVRPSVAHKYGNEEKLGYLLESLGLAARRLDSVSDVADVLAAPIDWPAVQQIVESERMRSAEYLRGSLQDRSRQ
jgi:hypothetical protein